LKALALNYKYMVGVAFMGLEELLASVTLQEPREG